MLLAAIDIGNRDCSLALAQVEDRSRIFVVAGQIHRDCQFGRGR